MNLKALRDHYIRIDARSLGAFRIAMGAVLIGDLVRRYADLTAFYSNDGVLPNHNHLFNLRETGRVFSVYHAFSTPGENAFAFLLTLLVYVAFLVGYKTRAMHAVALFCLVSLSARNILTENAGNYLAIALLAFTVFLPLGSRFSIDALKASFSARREKNDAGLNDRSRSSPLEADAELAALRGQTLALGRGAGWSPVSLAALATLVQIAIVPLVVSLKQNPHAEWRDGTALASALFIESWVSEVGASVRGSLPLGVIKGLSSFIHYAGFAIPALLAVPPLAAGGREGAAGKLHLVGGALRALAGLTLLVYGVLVAVLFDFGLYGWSIAAASMLVLVPSTWDLGARIATRPSRRVTLIYDADCGVCFWLCRLLRRLDSVGHITFQGNDSLSPAFGATYREGGAPKLRARDASGKDVERDIPKELTPELAAGTLILVDAKGRARTHLAATILVARALPLGWLHVLLLGAVAVVVGIYWLFVRAMHLFGAVVLMLIEVAGLVTTGVFGLVFGVLFARAETLAAARSRIAKLRERGWLRRLRSSDETPLAETAPGAFYDWPYLFVARRRHRISAALGLGSCGVPAPDKSSNEPATPPPPSPALRLVRRVFAVAREAIVVPVFIAMLAQTAHANALPTLASAIPRNDALAAIATWPRMLAHWDLLAGAVPREAGVFVVDAQTRGGQSIDLLTGREPVMDQASMRGTGLGQMWNSYLARIATKEYEGFQRAFRDYLAKGGPLAGGRTGDQVIVGFDAYWVVDTTPRFGQRTRVSQVVARDKVLTHSRGGRMNLERMPGILRRP